MHFELLMTDLFGNGSVPYDTTIRNDLLLMNEELLAKEDFFFELNDILLKKPQPKKMTIDIDGTYTTAYGHQALARCGYTSSDHCIETLVLLISWFEMNSPFTSVS